MNRTTRAQRINARHDKIWERASRLKAIEELRKVKAHFEEKCERDVQAALQRGLISAAQAVTLRAAVKQK